MLYRKNGEWAIVPYKVRYTENGKEKEKYTEDKQWWENLAEKHEHIEIIEFIDVVPTVEQETRLEEIKNIGEGFGAECSTYVESGELPDEINHPLWSLKTDKSLRNMKPIELTADKQQVIADGQDTAIITGKLPPDYNKVHVIVNSPPPVYEETNDGEIEIEFTTEDEGFHAIEVTAGNHRGLIVIEGVSTNA